MLNVTTPATGFAVVAILLPFERFDNGLELASARRMTSGADPGEWFGLEAMLTLHLKGNQMNTNVLNDLLSAALSAINAAQTALRKSAPSASGIDVLRKS
ncbi:MAG: hypothetical protein WCF81_18540 [Roseiarcus sp.]